MRLNLKNISTDEIEFALPGPRDQECAIHIEQLRDVCGVIERRASRLCLQQVQVGSASLARVTWSLADGELLVRAPSAAAGLVLDVEVDFGPSPAVAWRAALPCLSAEAISLSRDGLRLSGALDVTDMKMQHEQAGGEAVLRALDVQAAQLCVAALLVRCEQVHLGALQAAWPGAGGDGGCADTEQDSKARALEVGCELLHASGLALSGSGLEVLVARMEAARGVRWQGDQLLMDELVLDALDVSIDDLAALGAKDSAESAAAGDEAAEPRPERTGRPFFDLRLLDRIHGNLAIDLTLDATVPVIGRRRATHAFRVKVTDGTFNYKELERGLRALEDAVLDFAVRDDVLVLERDLPIIRMRKDIVRWPLDAEELALALASRARLRTIPKLSLPGSDDDKNKKKPSFQLHSLRIGDTAIDARIERGDPVGSVIANLSAEEVHVRGEIRYPADHQMRVVSATACGVQLSLRELPLGAATLRAGDLDIEAIDKLEIGFHGFAPQSLRARLRGVRLRNAVVTVPATRSGAPRSD